MPKLLEDLTGKKFNKLTVIKKVKKPNKSKTHWLCLCECGKETVLTTHYLKTGKTKSCGCYRKEVITTHNKTNDKLYWIRNSMIQRCCNSNNRNYHSYGGRGIKICDEWKNDFQAFYDWAVENGYKDGLSIDRVDNNGDYTPSNCRWVTPKEQANNTRHNRLIKINGQTKTMQQWADEYNMSKHTFYARYAKGLRGEDLIAPVKKYKKRKNKNENLS